MKEGEEWCIRSNRELEELIDGEDIRFIMFMLVEHQFRKLKSSICVIDVNMECKL